MPLEPEISTAKAMPDAPEMEAPPTGPTTDANRGDLETITPEEVEVVETRIVEMETQGRLKASEAAAIKAADENAVRAMSKAKAFQAAAICLLQGGG